MLRLRLFRILLPVLLVVLGVLLWMSWQPRGPVHAVPTERQEPRVEGITFKEWEGDSSTVAGEVALFQPGEGDTLHLEKIRNLEIEREDGGPLIVSALRADRKGVDGERMWHFEDRVVFREAEEGLTLALPTLDIDEEEGVARSSGDIRFEAPSGRGKATALLYGLRGQPGELTSPEFQEETGGWLKAERAILLDGIRDVELVGNVRTLRGEERLDADRLRVIRAESEKVKRAEAQGSVSGSWPTPDGPPVHVEAQRLDADWDDEGEVEHALLVGDALISRGTDSLSAATLEAIRGTDTHEAGWRLEAEGDVFVQGRMGVEHGLLRADTLHATVDQLMNLHTAEARGRVSFEGREARGEADMADFSVLDLPMPILLRGTERRKARLGHGRTRVAAFTIRTDPNGERMSAVGKVEATLMPEGAGVPGAASGNQLFLSESAIHFVSAEMDSEGAGARIEFRDSVRGWQGERNLAAEKIVVIQEGGRLEATENVTTRVPRERDGKPVSEADYIQIISDRLTYDDSQGYALYEGAVRVRLAEGWLESEKVEVELTSATREIKEIRASGQVRLEMHRTSEREMARPVSGTADRLVYVPAESSLRLFGDQTPAAVRRIGEGGGTTTGRVLRYLLDTGRLEVDSGDQGSGRIRTPDK